MQRLERKPNKWYSAFFFQIEIDKKKKSHDLSACIYSAVNKGQLPAKTAGYWPIFGRLLSSRFTINFGKKLKIRKRSNKNNCEASASNVWAEIKAQFRSFKRVNLSVEV